MLRAKSKRLSHDAYRTPPSVARMENSNTHIISLMEINNNILLTKLFFVIFLIQAKGLLPALEQIPPGVRVPGGFL